MIEDTKRTIESKELALELFDKWIRERQKRPEIRCSDKKQELEKIRQENFANQLARPRQRHLEQLKKVAKAMTTADKVALLVMMELPALEISTLMHRLSIQLAENKDAAFFSKVNQVAACGSGCG